MRASVAAVTGLGLLGLGYVLGSMHGSGFVFAAEDEKAAPRAAATKDGKEETPANPALAGLTDETMAKLKGAATALKAAQDALKLENRYKSATKGINITGILIGNFNSQADLDSPRGPSVDPETFAALYANMAEDAVAKHLRRDEEGRLTYKDKLIRMYSIERLRKLYANRAVLTGEEIPLTEDEKAARERESKTGGKSAPAKTATPKVDEKKTDEAKEETKEEKK